jgi:hypothetical protein
VFARAADLDHTLPTDDLTEEAQSRTSHSHRKGSSAIEKDAVAAAQWSNGGSYIRADNASRADKSAGNLVVDNQGDGVGVAGWHLD